MDGIKVTGKILKNGQFRTSALTAVSSSETTEEAISADAWFVVTNILKNKSTTSAIGKGFKYSFPLIF